MTMTCAACKGDALQRLPANRFSRHPGYRCAGCGAIMRPPRSTPGLLFACVLAALFFLAGGALSLIALIEEFPRRAQLGAVGLSVLGAVVAIWAIQQLRLPVPLGYQARPSQFGLMITIFAVVLLVVIVLAGGGVFAVMYVFHEM
jgi:hypothetical protein